MIICNGFNLNVNVKVLNKIIIHLFFIIKINYDLIFG